MEVIPAISILDGKCVRFKETGYTIDKMYSNNPVEVTKRYADMGIQRIHVTDINGVQSSCVSNIDMLNKICLQTSLRVSFEGGINTGTDIYKVFDAGASYAYIDSATQNNSERTYEWMKIFGSERIILKVKGWGEKLCANSNKGTAEIALFDVMERYWSYAYNVLCTDISRNRTMSGRSIDLYKKLMKEYPGVRLLVSGGIRSMNDIRKLWQCGIDAAVINDAIFENKIVPEASSLFLLKQNPKSA